MFCSRLARLAVCAVLAVCARCGRRHSPATRPRRPRPCRICTPMHADARRCCRVANWSCEARTRGEGHRPISNACPTARSTRHRQLATFSASTAAQPTAMRVHTARYGHGKVLLPGGPPPGHEADAQLVVHARQAIRPHPHAQPSRKAGSQHHACAPGSCRPGWARPEAAPVARCRPRRALWTPPAASR
jgi:hypothetical protein